MARPLGVAIAAGAASALGFAPVGAWPLTLAGFALLLHLVSRAPSPKSAARSGWAFGVGHFVVGLNWIATAFRFQAEMPAWLGWIAVVLLSLYLAVYPALACFAARWLAGGEVRGPATGRSIVLMLAMAGAWTLSEWLRGTLFTGFPWNPLAVAFVDIAWPARLIGTYGVSALVMLAAGGLWLLATGQRRAGAAISGAMAALALLSALMLRAGPAEQPAGPRIALVQPNVSQDDKKTIAGEAQTIRKLAPLSGPAGATPRLLLWPEAAIPDYLESGYPARYYTWNMGGSAVAARLELTRLLGPNDMLLTGVTRLEFRKNRLIGARNSVVALDDKARIRAVYDKAHLVPYGEYLPLESVLSSIGLSRLVAGSIAFWPGSGPRSYDLGRFGTAGVQICYEIVFSGQVVDARNRPDFIFNPSNDAWFGAFGPPQHLAQARLRAIEEGLPVLRATTNGVSAVVDANGRVLSQIERHRADRIDLNLPPPHPATPFARIGNAAALLLAFLLMAAAVALRRRRG